MDYINIGPVPAEEDCAQVGSADYHRNARKECQRFADGIIHFFGTPPVGARVSIKSFPHDFGSYLEVIVYYDENVSAAVDYAFRVEAECPGTWQELEA